mgnify:FL=1
MSRLYTKFAIDEIRFQGYNKLTDYLRNDRTGHIMENEFVRLYQSTNRLQAEMIVDNLKHNGINSYYKSEGADEIMQLSAGMSFMGDSVYVRRADIGKAQTVLKDFLNASGVKDLSPIRRSGPVRIGALIWVIIIAAVIVASVVLYIIKG